MSLQPLERAAFSLLNTILTAIGTGAIIGTAWAITQHLINRRF